MNNRIQTYHIDAHGVVRDRCPACGAWKGHFDSRDATIGWWQPIRREVWNAEEGAFVTKWVRIPQTRRTRVCSPCGDKYDHVLLHAARERGTPFLEIPAPRDAQSAFDETARVQLELERLTNELRALGVEKSTWEGK